MQTPRDLLDHAMQAHQGGRWDEARAGYEQVLAVAPDDHNALTNLGTLHIQLGRFDEGIDLIDRSLARRPNQPNALANKATGQAYAGRLEAALQTLEQAPALDGGGADVCVQVGDALRNSGAPEAALRAYDTSLRWRPDHPDTLNRRGAALIDLRRAEDARAAFEAVLALQPQHAGAAYNLAMALRSLQRFDEALAALRQAAAGGLDPAMVDVAIGNTLRDLCRIDEALAAYDRALAVRAEATVLCERAITLVQVHRLDQAEADFRAALTLSPGNPFFTTSLGCALLAAGRHEEGWPAFETRWQGALAHVRLPEPRLTGESDVRGRTILLMAEAGLGDTIQFARYAPLLAMRGARVMLCAPRPLVALCRTLDGVSEVFADGEPLPPFDLCSPLMSLPLVFGATLQTIPTGTPYLIADPGKAAAWARRLGPKTRPRVGLVWSGGHRPDQPELWALNDRRNIPLAMFEGFAGLPVEFHSLQKGQPAEGELEALLRAGWAGPPIVDHAGDLRDFTDTAALIDNLDLVIAVDTSTAHLAGALGKPVWILNRYDSCWRWMTERTDSPWYPTARLFRERTFRDWPRVLEEVREALAAWSGRGESNP